MLHTLTGIVMLAVLGAGFDALLIRAIVKESDFQHRRYCTFNHQPCK